jgi:tRNA(Ile)-lysidine synthase
VEVVAAHVNHGLRGRESDADAEFVRGLAERWNLRYLEAAVAPRPGGSEEAARDARYDALGEMAIRCGADRVATAHTADDQAETVLLRLIRGAGLRGLAGMPARGSVRGVRVVRPLLGATREQVLDYLRRHGLPHRLDASNESAGPSRNFLRLEILPRIRSRLNPSAREAILRAAAAIRDAEGYLAAEARRVLPEVMRQEESGKISLDAARMLHYPKPLNTYLFRFAVQELNGNTRDLATAHIETLLSLVTTHRSRAVDLPGGARARREGGGIVLSRRSRTAPRKATSRG